MKENTIKMALVLGFGALIFLYLLLRRPDFLSSSSGLALLLGFEVVVLALAKFTQVFFPLLMLVFLGAGTAIPGQLTFAQARWILLGLGAVVGVIIYMRSRGHYFGIFHLIAIFCILSAAISSSVSQYVWESKLKALSLGLLLVYAGSGARLAATGSRAEMFFRGLLKGCEILTWVCAIAYLALDRQLFGNPNSLGAVAGVVVVPTLFWGLLTSNLGARRIRLGLETCIAALLLMSSFSRAGISSTLLACFVICVTLRRYRLMVKSAAAIFVLAACAFVLIPHSSYMPEVTPSQGLGEAYLYKGKHEAGVFGSRLSVWQETLASINESPWFGTGFGTSKVTEDLSSMEYGQNHVDSWVVREHGNSYLAITEWTGLLGVIPFLALVALVATYACKVFLWLRRTGNVFSPAVPAATIVIAGLFDALFEDWMFAVGYYLCVFFWVIAFILVDVLPWRPTVVEPNTILMPSPGDYLPVASGQ